MSKQDHRSADGLAYTINQCEIVSNQLLVCLHGWSCRKHDFSALFEELTRRKAPFESLAIDLPGHGESPTEASRPDMKCFANVVLNLLRQLCQDYKTIIILGHSMSARIAMHICTSANRTAQVKGIILLDGSNFTLKPQLSAFDKENPEKPTISPTEAAATKSKLFETMLSTLTPLDFKAELWQHLQSRDTDYMNRLRRTYLDYDRDESEMALAQIYALGGKVLTIASSNMDTDQGRIPMKHGERSKYMDFVKSAVPSAQEVVIPDSAHFPHVDRPDVVAAEIVKFMKTFDE